MALSPQRKAQAGRLAGRSIANFIRLVYRTCEIAIEPIDGVERLTQMHPCIMAGWHGQFMMLAMHRPDVPTAAMVARHADAELIGSAMSEFHVDLIRGAGAGDRKKDRGGATALRAAVKVLQAGQSFVMTADVPPGPARRAGDGIVTLAQLSGRPVIPVAAATSRYKALNTWSRMTINLPYSKLAYIVGEPVFVPRDADADLRETLRCEIERSLNDVTARAYALAGADPARATPPSKAMASTGPQQPGWRLKTYRGATRLLGPVAPALLRMRERNGKEDPARRPERLGIASAPRPGGLLIWIHAASVGETNAILPLLDRLATRQPAASFVLTTGTVTSASMAAQRLKSRAIHQYVPLDTPQFARKFLAHWQPDLAVFTESEIWPNLILETAARGTPLALVNARISNRSFNRWRRSASVAGPLFGRFSVIVAQNDKLGRRFSELGAPNVAVAGNLKIDAPPPPVDAADYEKLRSALKGRPLFVAASTHEGEEAIVADAHRALSGRIEGLCTIIAPRHPERGTGIAERLKGLGLTVAQRSLGALPDDRTGIYVADTIGELGLYYALSSVVFIGGSLIEHGGQNPVEAVRHGAVVMTGPSTGNFRDIYAALLRHKGAIEVRSAAGIAALAFDLLTSDEARQRSKAGAALALSSLGGGLERTVQALEPLLPSGPDVTHVKGEGMLRATR